MDDYALAKRLVDLNTEEREAPQIMYVPGRGWYYWNADRWNLDTIGVLTRLAVNAIDTIEDDARPGRSEGRLKAMINLAASLPGVSVAANQLDGDPYLLNTPQGYVDLRLSTLSPPNHHKRLTKLTTANYSPQAQAPLFKRFLEEILPDPETRSFLQRAMGYSITGNVNEEVIFFLVGKGANGKTTLLSTLRHILGDYANTVPSSLLTSRYQASHDADRLALQGLRFAVANETDFGQSIAEAKVKSLVSTDAITARGAYERSAATFAPTHHLWLSTNYLPSLDGSDDGMGRRLVVIEFPRSFNRDERDPHLQQALLQPQEASGILNWLIEGAHLYLTQGLNPPIQLQAQVDEYREDMDVFSSFIREQLEFGTPDDPSFRATNPEVWDAFTRWQSSEPPIHRLGRRQFGSAMKRHFKQANRDGSRIWPGIRVRQHTPDQQQPTGQAERDALTQAGL